jgi:hypothetical protein
LPCHSVLSLPLVRVKPSVRLFLTSQKAGGKLPYLYVMLSEKLLPPSFSKTEVETKFRALSVSVIVGGFDKNHGDRRDVSAFIDDSWVNVPAATGFTVRAVDSHQQDALALGHDR